MEHGVNLIVDESTGYILARRAFIFGEPIKDSYNHWRDWASGAIQGLDGITYAKSERIADSRLGRIFVRDETSIDPLVLLDFVHDANASAKVI